MHANPSQRVATDFAWRPSAKQLEAANVARLARALGCAGYGELHALSIDDPDRFWRAVVDDLGIPLARHWDAVLDDSRGVEWTTWFEGARLNVADACVHRWAHEMPDREAAVWVPEDGERRSLTCPELVDRPVEDNQCQNVRFFQWRRARERQRWFVDAAGHTNLRFNPGVGDLARRCQVEHRVQLGLAGKPHRAVAGEIELAALELVGPTHCVDRAGECDRTASVFPNVR